jgi:endonuclease YncB( thermonuclease family)
MATENQSGWATVTQIVGPATLAVRNDAGERFNVWQIGIIGPTEGQGDWLRRAAAEQSNRIPPGTRVWLQTEDGIENPDDGWVLRHVLRDADPNKPVAAELVRAGGVWVFPHAHHRYAQLYADLQAEAVVTRTGAWAETPSSAVFRPRGVTNGGFPINPAVEPALRALDTSPMGHDLLLKVNAFPVEVGITPRQESVAYFSPRFYSVQLNDDVMGAAPESIAAVLIHEITHARQMADRTIDAKDIGCYESEIEAFNISAQYWLALYGPNGKPRPTHWLDRELNDTLRQYQNNQLAERVRRSYGRQCAQG